MCIYKMRQFFETSIPKGLHISKINERDVITVESLIKFWSFFMSKTITNTGARCVRKKKDTKKNTI